jgi:hypothetical protein
MVDAVKEIAIDKTLIVEIKKKKKSQGIIDLAADKDVIR